MSNTSKCDAKDVRYYLECASHSINDASIIGFSVQDPILHKQLDECKEKVNATIKYLNERLNPRKGG